MAVTASKSTVSNMEIVKISEIPNKVDDVPLDDPKVREICLAMLDVCRRYRGIGLSAVQVGIPWKLFVVFLGEDRFSFFANCEYDGIGEKHKSLEGCLSIPNRYFLVDRYRHIRLTGHILTKNGFEPFAWDLEDRPAVFQHEVDHQRLILISDIGIEWAREISGSEDTVQT